MSVRPEVVLLLGAAGVGVLALLFPLLLRQGEPPAPLPGLRLGIAFGVIALLFGLTRLSAYPFSPGGTLGNGMAVGGAMALVTTVLAAFWPGAAASAVGAGGGALLGAAIVLLWHRGYPNAALVGFGAGHAIATLLAAAGNEEPGSAEAGLWAGPVMAAILAGAALLAIDRANGMSGAERLAVDGKVWWVWPTAVMAAVLAGQMVGRSLLGRRAGGYWAAGLVAALLLFLLWLRFPRYAPLMAPPAAGFVTALLLLGCSGVQENSVARSPYPAGSRTNSPLSDTEYGTRAMSERLNALPAIIAPALVVVLLATAYRLYTGYGIALAALGAAAALPWLAEREPRALGRALFGLLAAAVLFRVYYNSYDLRSSDLPLTAHYALVSLIAGALAPFALALFQATGDRRQATGPGVQGSGITGETGGPALTVACRLSPVASLAAAAALPVLLTLFWGQKAGGGLLLGVVIGQGYRMFAALLEADAPGRVAAAAARVPEAALLVMAWITVQLLDRIEVYGLQLLRLQRVGLVAALVAVCFVVVLIQMRRAPTPRAVDLGPV